MAVRSWSSNGLSALAIAGLLAVIALVLLPGPLRHRLRLTAEHLAGRLGWMRHGQGVAGAIAFAAVPVGAAAAGPVPPTQIGINIGQPFYSISRIYANMAIGTAWNTSYPNEKGRELTDSEQDPDNNPVRIAADGKVQRNLQTPTTGPGGARFRCTFDGAGLVRVDGDGDITEKLSGPHSVSFRVNSFGKRVGMYLAVQDGNPKNMPRNFDCREVGLDRAARFDPAAIARLGRYKVLRFMDLQRINANERITWATRTTPQRLDIDRRDGMAIEDIVALANEARADPWVSIPWNADADYVERFARYVHDHLAAGRVAYVEVGNEVWNQGFPGSQQARAEGVAAHLSSDPNTALAFRYAQRTGEVMRIWTNVFADRPARLVRIAATQNVVPGMAETVLGYRDTARYVDALATAPYFGHDIGALGTKDPDQIFPKIRPMIDQAIDSALQNKAIAHKYGKRYIAYEGGQHIIIGDDVPLVQRLEHDPRMYDLYRAYLGQWRAKVGDVITLYNNVAGIGWFGAFGLQEYDSQPLAETPKLRAVQDELGH